ncbi:2-succinyl-6-hydroxy-2,4-cyclohexadiene-1-carboxylate synthase [Castellaniella defragrans]
MSSKISQALAALERLFEVAHESTDASPAPFDERALFDGASSIAGAYRRVECGDDAALLYYDASGDGMPLVMLHTAGADSRQYLGLLADLNLRDEWRMFAFDMPFHGRSLPVESWHGQTYRLRQSEYVQWCLRFIEDVVRKPAVVMGCSMGASISIALAASGSPWVRAVIALEAPDRSPGRLNPYLDHAAVNQSLHSQAYVRGLMSPTSPQRSRDLACWIYSQGGPGVYAGDLYFYSEEYDGAALAKSIDTSRCPVFLLTGEYDYSAPPESTRRLAEQIPGAYVQELEGLGHFPMIENPVKFKEALRPVLVRVRKAIGQES